MATLDGVLLITTLAALVVVGVIVGVLMPPMARAQEQAQGAVGRLGGVLEGALRAIRTVKASRAEHRESERVIVEATESARQSIRAVRFQAVAFTVAGFGVGLAIMLILGLGAYRVGEGLLTVSGTRRLPALRVPADGAGVDVSRPPSAAPVRDRGGDPHPRDRRAWSSSPPTRRANAVPTGR